MKTTPSIDSSSVSNLLTSNLSTPDLSHRVNDRRVAYRGRFPSFDSTDAIDLTAGLKLADRAVVTRRPLLADYVELAKPRLVLLVLFTTSVGFLMGLPGWPMLHPYPFDANMLALLLHTLIGTAMVAVGSMALNQVIECDPDSVMQRTASRPIAQGRIGAFQAKIFGFWLIVVGGVYLGTAVNGLACGLTLLACVIYLSLYIPLKRHSSFNTIVGAVVGAMGPMIGYAAAAGRLEPPAWVLFAILGLWQVPHFLSIAWIYRDDYQRAGFQMLPAVDINGRMTARQIVLYTAALLPISLLPTPMAMAGVVYFIVALTLGIVFVACSLPLLRTRDHRSTRRLAQRVFIASILYLPLLLMAMLVDRIAAILLT